MVIQLHIWLTGLSTGHWLSIHVEHVLQVKVTLAIPLTLAISVPQYLQYDMKELV